MDYAHIITQLDKNKAAFAGLLFNLPPAEYEWRPSPDKWNILEVACHLRDEEVEDFRTRTKFCLELPPEQSEGKMPPTFDPAAWVKTRNYAEDNYLRVIAKFLDERTASVTWLRSLEEPDWDRGFDHPRLGRLTAHDFLVNWLAHDYLHLQQIMRLKLGVLKAQSGNDLGYARG